MLIWKNEWGMWRIVEYYLIGGWNKERARGVMEPYIDTYPGVPSFLKYAKSSEIE